MKKPTLRVRVARLDAKLRGDVLLIPVLTPKGKVSMKGVNRLPTQLAGRVKELVRRYHGGTKAGGIDGQVMPAGASFGRAALVGLGEKKPSSADVRNAAGLAMGWCQKHGAERVAVAVEALKEAAGSKAVEWWVEASVLAGFKFTRLRSKMPDKDTSAKDLCLATASAGSKELAAAARRARVVADAVNLARRLGHEPPNVINPVSLANRCRAIAREYKLRCTVLDERAMKAKKMGAFLAVGMGSASKPRMIILEHRGSNPKSRPIVLVGKAVTLDTGGYSIKPGPSIPDMKYDKCGGMAVIGTLAAAASLKIRRRVIGIVGAAENMISAEAYRPGDIVTASNGISIEVLNTDAEGRLVLADCLHYGEKTYKPAAMIDLATLTGACEIALGTACAGLFSNNDKLAKALTASGERADERVWRLPLWPVYREQIAGVDGDIKNIGGRPAGAITAAMFLKEFVADKTPWAHLDIAGPATTLTAQPYCPVGATGYGVRLLMDYLQKLS
ncbi:MAG: leucyl aminopeptidase [Planctomycetota bacterium]|nr:leucyl aminopeptidase [Planctomycetota bacterium]